MFTQFISSDGDSSIATSHDNLAGAILMLFTSFSNPFFLEVFARRIDFLLQEVRRPPLNDVLRRLSGSLKKLRKTLGEVEQEEEPATGVDADARNS